MRGVFEELLWMLRGSTDVRELQAKNVHIWDEWADENGQLGPVYGAQWRHWNRDTVQNWQGAAMAENYPGIDQIDGLITRIKDKPDDRRLIVTAWNPDEVPEMALPICHCFFQCWTRELTLDERLGLYNGRIDTGRYSPNTLDTIMDEEGVPKRGLSLQLYQRSCDVFLGVPFNIASYALLTHMLAQVCGMVPLEFVHTYGDVHIYNNHREQVDEQLTREPFPLPTLHLNPEIKDIDGFTIDDIMVENYQCHKKIAAPVSV